MSIISWLDASTEEQRKVNEIVRLFSQRETQDEMGGRRIVVALSDALFPGTSVLHSRARYLVFIPWCCTKAASSKRPVAAMDALERQLIASFLADDSVPDIDRLVGLIGRDAGPKVKQLPSTAYWTALSAWGILQWPGSLRDTLDRTQHFGRLRPGDHEDELAERAPRVWHPALHDPPKGFPKDDIAGGFRLSFDEAQWLRERWLDTAAGSMLVHLVESGELLTEGLPWEQPVCWSASSANRELLEHAQWFSLAIRGAQLLYGLQVAERYEAKGHNAVDVDPDVYRAIVEDWEDEVEQVGAQVRRWDPQVFWAELGARGAVIDPFTRSFFDVWFDVLRSGASGVANDPSLLLQVRDRERRLKKPQQSRLNNDALLASWKGGLPGVTTFRWGSVRQLVNDVLEGLGVSDAGT